MKSLIEKIFKREKPEFNYIISKYEPSRAHAMSKPERTSEYDVESPITIDEMAIDNIYKKS